MLKIKFNKIISVLHPLVILLLFVLFLVRGTIYLDPDFGWHIRMGQIIIHSGIPKTDLLTYTMPSFPYVDHEWLTDVVFASLYPHIRMIGLSILFSLLAIASLIIVIPKDLNKYSVVALLLISPLMLSFFGVRPQVISWFFVAILIKLVFDKRVWRSFRLFVPILFLIWANLHGGFLIGFIILFFTSKNWQSRKELKSFCLIFILSLAATLVNPYFTQLWSTTLREGWVLSFNPYLKYGIDEWTPLFQRFSTTLLIFLASSIILLTKYRENLGLAKITLYTLLLIAAISGRRNLPSWLLVALPIYCLCLKRLFGGTKLKGSHLRVKLYLVLLLSSFSIFGIHSRLVFKDTSALSETLRYPSEAVRYLQGSTNSGRILSSYAWGGYLEWKLPHQKVFIDGRMPTWIWHAPARESSWAFYDFNTLLRKRDISTVLSSYNITIIIWPKQEVFSTKFIPTLEKNGWKIVYNDPIAIVYEK